MSVESIYTRNRTPDYTAANRPLSGLTLYQMAEQLMTRTLSAFAEKGVTPPDRQIIYTSPVPADCAQLAILFAGWVPFPAWEGSTVCKNFRWCGQFTVAITRDTPAVSSKGKSAPPVAAMQKAAQIASADAEVLVAVVQGLNEIGQEFALETGAPEGGLQSCVLLVQIPAFGGME